MTYTKRDLFGGAIVANFNSTLIDVSDLRQVPDTQEVFLYPNSSVSIVVEILQRVEKDDSSEAARFHFDSLAHDNSAQDSIVESVSVPPSNTDPKPDDTPTAIVLSGLQKVSKYNRTNLDEVRILLALFRVASKNIDLVVTFNVPLTSEDGGAIDEAGLKLIQADFDTLAESLRIVDFSLFA